QILPESGLWNDVPGDITYPYILEFRGSLLQTEGLSSGMAFPIGNTVNTFVVTDAGGNQQSCSFTVFVEDNSSIRCPNDIFVSIDFENNTAIVDYTDSIQVSTPCGPIIDENKPGFSFIGVYNGSAYYQSQSLLNWEDARINAIANGGHLVTISSVGENQFIFENLDSESQNLWIGLNDIAEEGNFTWANGQPLTYTNWNDNEPNNFLGNENAVVLETVNGGQWNDVPIEDNFTYILEIPNIGGVREQIVGLSSGSEFPIGTTTNIFVFTNANGSETICTFDVTVDVNNTIPTITCPNSIIVNNDIDLCGATVIFENLATATGFPTPNIIYSHNSGDFFPVGTTLVTVKAVNSVDSAFCTFEVEVLDNQLPTITCPDNITVEATSISGAVVNYTVPIGLDNCPGSITVMTTIGFESGATFPIGVSTVTYEVTDASGNSSNVATCSFTVTVNAAAPDITCPSDIELDLMVGECDQIVKYPPAVDLVGIPAGTITYSHVSGSSFGVGLTTVMATATNDFGVSSCSFNVTLNQAETQISCITSYDVSSSNVLTFSTDHPVGCSGGNSQGGFTRWQAISIDKLIDLLSAEANIFRFTEGDPLEFRLYSGIGTEGTLLAIDTTTSNTADFSDNALVLDPSIAMNYTLAIRSIAGNNFAWEFRNIEIGDL
ncbi:MAG TPA: HYR domain-containing protein, partial [Saprospiraceae bacterium]|nr:HYR domain-containing protein [Saprospiraceae bacterium]